MNALDKLKIYVFYPELKDLNLDENFLQNVLSNKTFHSQYKKNLKQFILSLKEVGLDEDLMKYHVVAALLLSQDNASFNYVSFINDNGYQQRIIKNPIVLKDPEFEKLYSLIGFDIFKDNIAEIIQKGYGQKLYEFLSKYRNIVVGVNNLIPELFDERVWNIIKDNPTIGSTTVLELFNFRFDTLINIINNGLYEGLKYTYEAIPESHNFIEVQLGYRKEGILSSEQFSIDFIQKIGVETLKKLYKRHIFSDREEFSKLFEIAKCDNYELIQDIVRYDTYDFSFAKIASADMSKKLIETNINYFNKRELFLNKYLGISRFDVRYIKLFLNAINRCSNIPEEFNNKYSTILSLLNQVMQATDEEIIEISKSMNSDNRNDSKKLIDACEIEGNDILKQQFVEDLKVKNQQIISSGKHSVITNNEKSVDVYELEGQPFTMLVHAIVDNRMSIHNSFVNEIVANPEKWNEIEGGNQHISTSLISDKYMVTYGIPNNNDTVMFGFNSLPWQAVKFTDVMDVGIDRKASTNINYNMRNRVFEASINTVATVDYVMEQTIKENINKPPASRMWNEIGLSRKNLGVKLRPDYIVCMDYVSPNSIKAAEYYGIPIYLIHRKYYPELPYNPPQINIENVISDELESETLKI
ncbi:MAG: hypothetical protein IJY87_05570 [Bacilli bacterium]|nr:hypothetical protein [Bacilli bacterium]